MLAAEQYAVVLNIKGVHCTSLRLGIEAMLKRVDAVKKTNVSFEEHVASVAYDPAKTNTGKLVETVKRMGYKAVPKK